MCDPNFGAVAFHRLDVSHVGMMQDLERRCFSLPWSEKQCRAAFAQPAFAAFGLLGEQELLAYVSVYHALDELEILNLAVAPGKSAAKDNGRRILQHVLASGA